MSRSPSDTSLEMVFVVGADLEPSLQKIRVHAEKLGWIEGKDYIILGDGKTHMSEVMKDFGKIKGRVDESTLYQVIAHGANAPKADGKGLYHVSDDMVPTAEIIDGLQQESGFDHIFVFGIGCHIGGVLKRKEVKSGITLLVEGNSKNKIEGSQLDDSVERVMSCKALKMSNLSIFKNVLQNSISSFYLLKGYLSDKKNPEDHVTKISRLGKVTFDEIEQIAQETDKNDPDKIEQLKITNQKNKNSQDFSYEGFEKLEALAGVQLSDEFYLKFIEKLRKKLKKENIQKDLIARSEKMELKEKKSEPEIPDPISTTSLLINILHSEVLRKNKSRMLEIIIEDNKELIDEWNKNGVTVLTHAVFEGNKDVVKFLLEHKADVDKETEHGLTPLLIAIVKGNKDMVELLLKHKASVDKENNDGLTPLMSAAFEGNKDIVELLLKHEASVDKEKEGWTALTGAISAGHKDIVKLLLEHKASVDKENKDGVTPLASAMSAGHKDMMEILLEHKASVDKENNDGTTPLTSATFGGNKDVVELLLKYKASVDKEDKDGEIALTIAALAGRRDIIEILLEYDADIDKKNQNGSTALEIAIATENKDMVEFLLESGADISIKNDEGETVLIQVIQNNNEDIVNLFIKSISENPESNVEDLQLDKALDLAREKKASYVSKLQNLIKDIKTRSKLITEELKDSTINESDKIKTTPKSPKSRKLKPKKQKKEVHET